MRLSLVVPCFNEQEVLPSFMKETCEVTETLKKKYDIQTEYIFVDDGSDDGTLAVLRDFHQKDPAVRYLSFSRNFGKEAAMYAGFKAAQGDLIAVMDADLQDPPRLLTEMAEALLSEEYDCAVAKRADRKGEPPLRSWFAKKFYSVFSHSADPSVAEGTRDYRMMTRQVLDAVLSISEYNRFSKGIFAWVGFRTKWIAFEHRDRAAGKTKWSFRRLAYYGLDGLIGYTVRPLEISAWIGLAFFLLSMIGIIFIIVRKLLFGDPVAGWPSLVCIILFCSGVQLFCTGIMGAYLAKTYLEVKHRPIYIIQETDEVLLKK